MADVFFSRLFVFPDLTRIMSKSRDFDELLFTWKAWHDASGQPIREKFNRYVELSNEAASLNGKFTLSS